MPERLGTTPSQTVGPFFHIGLPWRDGADVVEEGTPGAIRIAGRVLDGAGEPVPDALVETWQASPTGRYDHADDPRGAEPGFRGFARVPTDPGGGFSIRTVKPGPTPGPENTTQAPHLAVSVFARGLLHRVVCRFYFADEAEANAADPVLAQLSPDERATLVAQPTDDGYAIDVRLSGDGETAFLQA